MQHMKIFENCQKKIIIINIYISSTFDKILTIQETQRKYIWNIFVELRANFYQSTYISINIQLKNLYFYRIHNFVRRSIHSKIYKNKI